MFLFIHCHELNDDWIRMNMEGNSCDRKTPTFSNSNNARYRNSGSIVISLVFIWIRGIFTCLTFLYQSSWFYIYILIKFRQKSVLCVVILVLQLSLLLQWQNFTDEFKLVVQTHASNECNSYVECKDSGICSHPLPPTQISEFYRVLSPSWTLKLPIKLTLDQQQQPQIQTQSIGDPTKPKL